VSLHRREGQSQHLGSTSTQISVSESRCCSSNAKPATIEGSGHFLGGPLTRAAEVATFVSNRP
jgi:hypothetical protein